MKNLILIFCLLFSVNSFSQWTWVAHSGNLYLKNGNDSCLVDAQSLFLTAQWGRAFGTLSNQTDLQNALNAKANLTGATYTGLIKTSSSAGIGYATGAGSSVTQATSKTTGVTLNNICGRITMNGAALAAAAEVSFTLTNSSIAATDVVIVNIQSIGTAGSYFVTVGAVGSGSCSITIGNCSAGSLSQAIVLNFAVIKSVIL